MGKSRFPSEGSSVGLGVSGRPERLSLSQIETGCQSPDIDRAKENDFSLLFHATWLFGLPNKQSSVPGGNALWPRGRTFG
eukprot:7770398-Pyramimonas_sp.AAC.1